MNARFDQGALDARKAIYRLDATCEHRRVAVGGRVVCWRRLGAGPPLVLLHGGHGSWLHWVRNLEALAAHYTVWVPDMPGFGDSDDLDVSPRSPERLKVLCDTLLRSLNQLLGAQAEIDLVAFSFGCVVAAELCRRRGSIRRMALLGAAGHGGPRRTDLDLGNWRSIEGDQRAEALKHNLITLMLHQSSSADALALAAYQSCCESTRFHSKPFSRSPVMTRALNDLTIPILFVWGEYDITGSPNLLAERLTSNRPEREWVVMPSAGHWVQYERSHDIDLLLLRWLKRSVGEDRSSSKSTREGKSWSPHVMRR